MPSTSQHRQRLNVREEQMEMNSNRSSSSDDYDSKLKEAEKQLETLRKEQEELARRKQEVEELKLAKEDFLSGQIEVTEKLSASLTAIDRELYEMRTEMGELEQLRESFAKHAKHIEGINPESWSRENLGTYLQKAISDLEKAEEDYDQAVEHFTTNGRNRVFGSSRGGFKRMSSGSGEFATNFKNGLAFNLPIILLGTVGLIAYIVGR